MRNGKPQQGFTYLSLIILVAIIGLVSAATIKVGAVLQRSAAERELLAIGAEYADALESYAKATPPGQSPLPRSFKELLRDPRFPGVRRHLRRIYVDPMTGTAEWGIVYANNAQGQQGAANAARGTAATPAAAPAVPGAMQGAPQSSLQQALQSSQQSPQQSSQQSADAGTDGAGASGAAMNKTPQPLQAGGTAGMLAIYSLSNAKPVKIGNFPARFQGFDNRTRISDWKFARAEAPPPAAPAAGQPPQPGQPQQPGQQPGQAPQEPAEPAPPLLQPPEPPAEPPPEAAPRRGDEPAPAEEGQAAPQQEPPKTDH